MQCFVKKYVRKNTTEIIRKRKIYAAIRKTTKDSRLFKRKPQRCERTLLRFCVMSEIYKVRF